MTETQWIGLSAYNDFTQFSNMSYNCISTLITKSELVWKLLRYTSSDAWNKPDLSIEEKGVMIYSGQEDSSKYNVFMDGKQPDVLMDETTLLRIMPSYAYGINRTVGVIRVTMEVFSHYKINHLSNYKTRIDSIAQELLRVFNGIDIGGVGLMTFSEMGDESNRLFQAGQIPFGGKQLVFSTYSA